MATLLEYTLTLNDKISGNLRKIGIANERQLAVWGGVQKQVASADATMRHMGVSVGSLRERLAALSAQKEWIPASNLRAIRQSNIEIGKLDRQIRRLDQARGGGLKAWFGNLKAQIPIIGMVTNPLVLLGAALYKVNSYVRASQGAWTEEAEAQTKLAAVMRNVQDAGRAELDSILALTAAQQKLGVVGDEVQLAGAQELATYLRRTDSLKKLLPVMNDMLAQQYGLNATQESAVNIALMMGKVIEGQTGALSRYGYRFDKAQEKLLKYGKESERVATLVDVVTSAVGGVNAALAATPEGRLKQHANAMGDVQERFGQLYVQIKTALVPVFEYFGQVVNNVATYLTDNRDKITQVVLGIAEVFKWAFNTVGVVLSGAVSAVSWWIDRLQVGHPIITFVTGALGVLAASMLLVTVRAKALAVWAGIVKVAQLAWAAAQAVLNAVMWANPITLIVGVIIALIAVIGYVVYKTEGWGTVWDGVVGSMKNGFMAFVETIKLAWTALTNGLMIGLDKIMIGWYKFKAAIGMGNVAENRAAIARINADVQARQAAILDGVKKVADYRRKAMDAAGSIKLTWNSNKSIGDVAKKLRGDAGIDTAAVPGMANGMPMGTGVGDDTLSTEKGKKGRGTVDSIATGGQRSTSITINLQSLVETMNFNGGVAENATELEREVTGIFMRALSSAATAQ